MSYMSLYGAVVHTVRAGGVLTVESSGVLTRNKKMKEEKTS